MEQSIEDGGGHHVIAKDSHFPTGRFEVSRKPRRS